MRQGDCYHTTFTHSYITSSIIQMNTQAIRDKFASLYGEAGTLYTSPGRINVIGEHTDYNGAFVFPGAIDKAMVAEIRPNGTDRIRAFALDLGESAEFGLKEEDAPQQSWARYIFGVCREIQKRGGKIAGFDTVFAGDVPLGAGMSSSAALESTFAFALDDLFSLGLSKWDMAKIGQATEHNYCGVKCGIMDQFASVFGKAGKLLRLDCKSFEYEEHPFDPKGYRLLLVDSCVKHELASSAYNKRRESCERVVATLAKRYPEVKFLRDASFAQLEEVKNEVSEEHHGMSKLYEVSCEELDFLNDLAREFGVTGSRVMGGGFGGCTINLLKEELHDSFIAEVKKRYEAKYGIQPKFYDVVISDGARRL